MKKIASGLFYLALLIITSCTIGFLFDPQGILEYVKEEVPGGGNAGGNVKFTVTFDSNGGSAVSPDKIEVSYDSGNAVPAAEPVRSGYVFNGWNTKNDGTGSVFGAATEVSGDITVYASWVTLPMNPRYVFFDKNGGTYEASPQIKAVSQGASIDNGGNMPENPWWEGYNFEKWTDNPAGGTEFSASTPVNSNMTVYAQWKTKTYTVQFTGDNTSIPSQTVSHGHKVSAPANPTKTGYDFAGWFYTVNYGGVDITQQWIFGFNTVTSNITLKAQWKHSMPIKDLALLPSFLAESAKGFNEYDPVKLSLQVDLGDMASAGSNWQTILNALRDADNNVKPGTAKGRYVNLDLSLCTLNAMPGQNTFNPWRGESHYDSGYYQDIWEPNLPIGEQYIVELTLPNAATKIQAPPWSYTYGQEYYAAFYNFNYLESVHGPGLTTIGEFAFGTDIYNYKTRLARVDFPVARTIDQGAFQGTAIIAITEDNFPMVTAIGESAFQFCEQLSSAKFPKATAIGDNAFSGCAKLSTISFPAAVTISGFSFYKCEKLTSASASQFPIITTIGDGSFSESGLESVNLPAASIGDGTFEKNYSLREVSLPNVTTMGSGVFTSCTKLKTVDLPKVGEITGYAFGYCYSLETVNLSNVTKIAGEAFSGYNNTGDPAVPPVPLLTITLGSNPPEIDGQAFDGAQSVKIQLRVPSAVKDAYSTLKNKLEAFGAVDSVTLQGY